jgi:hypothetical protein
VRGADKLWKKLLLLMVLLAISLPIVAQGIVIVGKNGAVITLNNTGGGGGSVTSIATLQPILGGTITTTGILSFNYTDAYNKVQSDAGNITTGTISDDRLSTDVCQLSLNNYFTNSTNHFFAINGTQINGSQGINGNLSAPSNTSKGGLYQQTCTGTDKMRGINGNGLVLCATDATGSGSSSPGFRSVASVSMARTFTNVGLTFVDWYNVAGQGNFYKQINFSGFTQFRWIAYVDYVSGAGATQRVILANTSNSAIFDSMTFVADCPCDSGWKNIPASFNSDTYSIEPMINSTTAADDPVVYGYELWLQ